jgi:hypothetical protein
MITNEDARLGCAPFRNADHGFEEAGGLFTAAPTEGADLGGIGRPRRRVSWQEAEAERTKQACANPLPFIHQAKQQMHRADALPQVRYTPEGSARSKCGDRVLARG